MVRPNLHFLYTFLLCLVSFVAAEDSLGTTALQTCMSNSSVSASTFNVVYTPVNKTLTFDIQAISTTTGYVNITIDVFIYGFKAVTKVIEPCNSDLTQLCPIEAGNIDINGNTKVSSDLTGSIPGIGYTFPDIDAYVEIHIASTSGTELACLRADISNGRTVNVEAVSWITAAIAAVALLVSLVVSGLSHPNAAAHVATNAVALFMYFQGQALVGNLAIDFPPVIRSWTQNFQWSIGVIRVGWMQPIFTWYIKSTGGTPSTFLESGTVQTVILQKRDQVINSARTGLHELARRAVVTDSTTKVETLSGVDRVAYTADIEVTNLFINSVSWFFILLGVAAAALLLFRAIVHTLARHGKLAPDKFIDFRQGWKVVLKGMIYRLILICYPAMTLLCLWELYTRHSAGCVALAIVLWLVLTALLGYAAFRVIRLARRSLALHQNAAYILFSDPKQLSRWGFLYVQFRAAVYWFVVPLLAYYLLKGAITGLGQYSQVFQSFAFFVIELVYFCMIVFIRPFMDRRTNIFNIAIVSVNLFNSVLMLFFTPAFGIRSQVSGVMGLLFFLVNAAFATILLILIISSCCYALFAKNPDVRYQRMKDERNSYLKSKINLDSNTELEHISSNSSHGRRKEMFSEADVTDDYNKNLDSHGYPSSTSLIPPSTLNPATPGSPATSEHDALFAPNIAPSDRLSHDSRGSWAHQRGPNSPVIRTLSPAMGANANHGRRSPAVQNFSQPNVFTQQNTAYHAPIARPAVPLPQLNDDLRTPALPFAAPVRTASPANSENNDRWRVGVGYH